MRNSFWILLTAMILLFVANVSNVSAQIPKLINYQARLIDSNGEYLEDQLGITFRIFEDETGGEPIWSEVQTLIISNGFINVYLGDVNPVILDFDKGYWLEITVEGGDPYPRTQLSSVPYSFNAIKAKDAESAQLAQMAVTVEDGAITQAKLAEGVQALPWGAAGGDFQGDYPNPTLHPDAVINAIGEGEITQKMLNPAISSFPFGEARGDLTGFYPDPQLREDLIRTDHIIDLNVTTEKLNDSSVTTIKLRNDGVTLEKLAPGSDVGEIMFWDGEKWVLSTGNAPAGQYDILKYNFDDTTIDWQRDGLALPYIFNEEPVMPGPLFTIINPSESHDYDIIKAIKMHGLGTAVFADADLGSAIEASNSSTTFATISAMNETGTAILALSNPFGDAYVAEFKRINDVADGRTVYIEGNTTNTDGTINDQAVLVVVNKMGIDHGLAIHADGDIYATGNYTGTIMSPSGTFTEELVVGNTDRIYFDGSDGHIYVVNAEIAENAHVSGTFSVDGNAVYGSNVNTTGNYTSATGNLELTSGMLNVGGDVALGANLGIVGDYTTTDGTMTLTNGTLNVGGDVTFNSDLGVVGNYSSVSGSMTLTNGALTVGGLTQITNVTQSTSPATGALTVDGGVGIAKNLYVGGQFVTDNVDINGGAVDATVIGGSVPANGTFTNLVANTSMIALNVDIDNGNLDNVIIGATTPVAANFTTVIADNGTITTLSTTTSTIGTANITTANITNMNSNNVDIGGGEIDATPIGVNSASTGDFTTLTADNGTITTLGSTTGTIATLNSTTANITTGIITTGNITNMNSNNVDIGGGEIDATPIGVNSASTGDFTTLTAENGTITTLGSTTGTIATLNSTTANITTGNITNVNSNNVDIAGGEIDATPIGVNSASTGDFTTLTATTGTVATLGSTTATIATANVTTGNITTADINGGAIDGTAIGSNSASTGKFTTVNATNGMTVGTYSMPVANGTNGQVLQTNGSGVASWQTPSSGGSIPAGAGVLTSSASAPTGFSYSGKSVLVAGTGAWKIKKNMNAYRESGGVAQVGGKIYCPSGYDDDANGYLSSISEYNTATNTWAMKAATVTAREEFAIGVVSNKIYIVGGSTGSNYLNTVEEYNPGSDSKASKANCTASLKQVAGVGYGSHLYVCGGKTSGGRQSAMYRYSPSGNSWSTMASMSEARYDLALVESGGKLYAIGGYSDGYYTSAIEEYNVGGNSWSTKTPAPYGMYRARAVAYNGKIYVTSHGLIYNIASDSWDYMVGGESYGPCAYYNGSIYNVDGRGNFQYLLPSYRYIHNKN